MTVRASTRARPAAGRGLTRRARCAGGVYRWRHFGDYTPTGVLGVPAAATAEKGERLFDAAAEVPRDA